MNKYFLCLVLSLTVFCAKSFAQAPQLNSYTDTVSDYYINFYINYTSNDTGTIRAQIQLEQGSGNITYDSTYLLPASDTTAVLSAGPLFYCSSYSAFMFNMSNSHAYTPVTTLFSFNTLCLANGISEIQDNAFHIITAGNSLQIYSTQILPNSVAEVYDLTGRKILSANLVQPVQQITFDASAGLYLLRIAASGQSLYTTKFVTN